MKLSSVHPFFYHARIEQQRMTRRLRDLFMGTRFATKQSESNLAYVSKRHQSLLRRKLGSTDPILQENKVTNLRLAVQPIDGILLPPGSTFSFWQRVGKTTAEKGYIKGLLLSQGKVITGVGGGICQLANLLYWMVLHTPLVVIERHHHHFDPFPDDQRVLPFGSGASVFYNYVDLRFHNPTDQTFQIRVWLTDKHLKGEICTDQEWPYSYHLEERNHRFIKRGEQNFRENEIWRRVHDKRTGNVLQKELLIRNFSEVKYECETAVTL